ncbi:Lar family restriction alleviation protein [Azospirillum palustre]
MTKEFRHIGCGGEFDHGEPCPECGDYCKCGTVCAAPCPFCEETGANEAPEWRGDDTAAEAAALPVASPCEHCGSTDIFIEREDLSAYQARCNDCGSRGPIVEEGRYYDDEEAGQRDAIAAWNRRATPAALSASPAPAERFATPDHVVAAMWGALPRNPAVWDDALKTDTAPIWLYEAMDKALTGLTAPAVDGWRSMGSAPKDGTRFLAAVDDEWRFVRWGKTSHIPIYGFCLADQGPEDADLCSPSGWMPLPPAPSSSPAQAAQGEALTDEYAAGVDYTSMTAPEMLSACRDDAAKWAAAFCQTAAKLGVAQNGGALDEGWMIGWFANAIEQSHAVRRWAQEDNVTAPTVRITEEFCQVIREMVGVATGEDADPEFDAEQMALIDGWQSRLRDACAPYDPYHAVTLNAAQAVQGEALTEEREFHGQLVAMLKQMFDAPTMEAGYAILASFASQFYPGQPAALKGATPQAGEGRGALTSRQQHWLSKYVDEQVTVEGGATIDRIVTITLAALPDAMKEPAR